MGTTELIEWRCEHCRRERPPLLHLAEVPAGTTLPQNLLPGVTLKVKCRQCKLWNRLASTAKAA